MHENGADRNNLTAKTQYPYFVPSAFKKMKCWVLWSLQKGKNGKFTKVPKIANAPYLRNASKTDPDHWCDYDLAENRLEYFKNHNFTVNGLGVVLTREMKTVFVDIDHCIDPVTRQIDERGAEFLRLFSNTYCELSQSGTGLHFFAIGEIPRSFNNRTVHIEMYFDKAYCAFTGNAIQPYEITECQAALTHAYEKYKTADRSEKVPRHSAEPYPAVLNSDAEILGKAMKNKKFSDLYTGQWKTYYPSQSEADLYICFQLAFWSDRNHEAIDRIFKGSELYRAKWDEMHGDQTYGDMTIVKACKELEESFTEWKRRQLNEYIKCFLSEW